MALPLFPDAIGICKVLVFAKGGNRRTQRKARGARTRSNNKLGLLMTPGVRFEPGPQWWEASAHNTAPYLLSNVDPFMYMY